MSGKKWDPETKEERIRKWKDGFAKSGKKVGRPKGPGEKKLPREVRKCVVCSDRFEEIVGRERRVCSRACLPKDPEYIAKLRKAAQERDTAPWNTEEYRAKKCNPNLPAYNRYARRVRILSDENYAKHADLLNPENHPRTLCGVEGGWQLDHIKSIKKCYNEGLCPEEAADVRNLQMIPWKDNLDKRTYEPIEGSK